ncbi:GNS1/SUR4 membrane protein family [Raphanus sativus]|nr:GNS1/SUR4 membrane protein family [Raphanus sativus]
MYGYYFLCAIGWRPKWKRLVTDCQVLQFLLAFGFASLMFQEHVFGSGCSGFWACGFNGAFNASLLALFFNFRSKNYAKKTRLDTWAEMIKDVGKKAIGSKKID